MENQNLSKASDPKVKMVRNALLLLIAAIAVIFTFNALSGSPSPDPHNGNDIEERDTGLISYSGRVKYLPPNIYPDEDIRFELVNTGGEKIILLRAIDQKLEVVENLDVVVSGIEEESLEGEKVLLVENVTIKQ